MTAVPPRRNGFLRIALATLAAGLLAVVAVTAWTWQRSEAHLAGFALPQPFTAAIPTDAASLATGRRLALTRGCIGCHGERLQGEVFGDDFQTGRVVAANLTKHVHDHPPAVFERALRHGIGHDGRALYSMPSYNFMRLRDGDVAALYAYIRSLPRVETPLPQPHLGLPVRWAIARGEDAAVPAFLPRVPPLAWQAHPDPAVRRGEYLAMTSCNECHGFGLRGDDPFAPPGGAPPDLAIVAGYGKDAFVRLMRTGRPPGGRDLGLMTRVARGCFAHWTAGEVDDLHAFLSAMGTAATQ
ncbi:c-type cytochrome [Sandarakinorhabdus sp. DWP1-3-1]|uniref:c-type cytochrome n=1 Tax=Sandarakinorhabdus sp. DWP1-3-1 TaxID=2804627 RepID=UPI003CF471BE